MLALRPAPTLKAKGRVFAQMSGFHPERTAARVKEALQQCGVEEVHNWPAMKPGTVGLKAGLMMAAADRITIDITGRGGHGAYMRIGQGAENGVGSCFLHNTRYDFNDDILPLGAALHAGLVEQSMPLSVAR